MAEFRPKGGLRRKYEAGRINADTYIAAGGDPDVVRDTETRRAAAADAKKAADQKAGTRIAIGLAAIPVVLIGGCWAVTSMNSSKGTTPEAERHGVARVCEKAVRQQLNDPDSAKFDCDGVTPTTSTEQVFSYEGVGVVRADNAFGGTVSHTFTCAGTYTVATGEARAHATLI